MDIKETIQRVYDGYFESKTMQSCEAYNALYGFSKAEELAIMQSGVNKETLLVLCVFSAFTEIQYLAAQHEVVDKELARQMWECVVATCSYVPEKLKKALEK